MASALGGGDGCDLPSGAPPFTVVRWSVLSLQVCTSLSDEEATARLNEEEPTGINSDWELSEREGVEPVTCDRYPDTHRHLMFDC